MFQPRGILAAYLTDATALSLDSSLLTVLVDLIREERVKDLVNQFGGGGSSGTLDLLLNLCGMTYGLSPGSSPEDQNTNRDASHSKLTELTNSHTEMEPCMHVS